MSRHPETTLQPSHAPQPGAPAQRAPSTAPQWTLILLFLALIGSAPLIQLGLELRRGGTPVALDVFRQRPTAANLRSYEKKLETASAAAGYIRPWMQFGQFQWFGDGGSKALIGRDGWLFYRPGFDALVAAPGSHPAAEGPNDPLPAIQAFCDDLASSGLQLLVLVAPNKESIYPDKLTKRAVHTRTVRSTATRELLGRLRASGIETVDLFEVFAEARTESPAGNASNLYLEQDSHWSPAGVRVAAKAVANRLLKLGWVRGGSVNYGARPQPVRRTGDVLRMLQVPQLEERIGPELVPCEQVFRADNGQPYRDEPASEILILGDSFLRIYQQDEPGSAGFTAHLARELNQPLTSLVSDGGASTLVRQELFRRPGLLKGKKVVVWEFVERDILLGAEGWQIISMRDKLRVIHQRGEDASRPDGSPATESKSTP